MTAIETPPVRPKGGGTEPHDTLCESCGWTYSMICPECASGCGCSTGLHGMAPWRVPAGRGRRARRLR